MKNKHDNTTLQNLYEREYQKGYEAARTDALNAVRVRAGMWREKDRTQPQAASAFIKVLIAEDFEVSQVLLRIGDSTQDEDGRNSAD